MDVSKMKQQLAASQQKPGAKYEKVDYSKIYFRPKAGNKYTIRILPSKFDKSNPFKEFFLHYNFQKFPIAALTNWGEKDPVVDFAKELRKSSDKEDWTMAGKISPKPRYFAPVLVRGEESMGARLWEFGKETYQQLLGIATDEDYGDYTDISAGRDFTLEATEADGFGKKVTKTTFRIKPKTTEITQDATLLEKLLNEQPDVETLFVKKNFDELKELLQKWLTPEEEETHVAVEETEEGSDLPWVTSKAPEKSSSSDKFDKLFEQK